MGDKLMIKMSYFLNLFIYLCLPVGGFAPRQRREQQSDKSGRRCGVWGHFRHQRFFIIITVVHCCYCFSLCSGREGRGGRDTDAIEAYSCGASPVHWDDAAGRRALFQVPEDDQGRSAQGFGGSKNGFGGHCFVARWRVGPAVDGPRGSRAYRPARA